MFCPSEVKHKLGGVSLNLNKIIVMMMMMIKTKNINKKSHKS